VKLQHILAAVVLFTVPQELDVAQVLPQGPEFQVNTHTTYSQTAPSVGVDGMGNFVVAWTSFGKDGSATGIAARRFDSAGASLGAEFQVNTHTTSYQYSPAVAVDGVGNFVVVWTSNGKDGSGNGVSGQRFDSTGAPLGGEFVVNTYTTGNQVDASVAIDGMGDFVVVWSGDGQDGSLSGIFGQRFDSAGMPLGGEFQVNTFTTSLQQVPSVAMHASGSFVVAWTTFSEDLSGTGVFAQRYDSGGMPLGGEFQVNTYATGYQFEPAVAVDGSGNFVVAWTSDGEDGSGDGIFARRFDSAGAPLSDGFRVNAYTTSDQAQPAVAADASGSFVVAWTSYRQDGSGNGVLTRLFDRTGSPVGGEFQVNTYTTLGQYLPSVGLDGSGGAVVAWSSSQQDGSDAGVFGQRYCADFDGDGLCAGQDIFVTSPHAGDAVDCSNPTVTRPAFLWDAGNYEKFRVFIASDPSFAGGSRVASGDRLLTSTTYTPPPKKWKSACKKALAANPVSPVLYIKVQGVDVDLTKNDANRKTFSQVVRVSAQ